MSTTELHCEYFSSGRCRSCNRLGLAPEERFDAKFVALEKRLRDSYGPAVEIRPPFIPHSIFPSRSKAKMSVSGTLEDPCIGILTNELSGEELLECPLHAAVINRALQAIRTLIEPFKLYPYDIPSRRGELKGIILKCSADEKALTVRFVLRSTEAVPRIRKAATELAQLLPELQCVSANIQPVPHAILEGPEELVLFGERVLWDRFDGTALAFSPQSFAQVSPETAAALYREVSQCLASKGAHSLLDLFCGVGGFSLSAASYCERIVGIELSETAIECAGLGAERNQITNCEFYAATVAEYLARTELRPDTVICNPPRRGLGVEVCSHLERLRPERIFYSSCNPETLFADVSALTGYEPRWFKGFEMFPLTDHIELLCELKLCENCD